MCYEMKLLKYFFSGKTFIIRLELKNCVKLASYFSATSPYKGNEYNCLHKLIHLCILPYPLLLQKFFGLTTTQYFSSQARTNDQTHNDQIIDCIKGSIICFLSEEFCNTMVRKLRRMQKFGKKLCESFFFT